MSQTTRDALRNAEPGYRFTFTDDNGEPETYVRLVDCDPPYIYGLWANVDTGEILFHWSTLAECAGIYREEDES